MFIPLALSSPVIQQEVPIQYKIEQVNLQKAKKPMLGIAENDCCSLGWSSFWIVASGGRAWWPIEILDLP